MSLMISMNNYEEELSKALMGANWHPKVEYDWDQDKEIPIKGEWEKSSGNNGYNKISIIHNDKGSFIQYSTYEIKSNKMHSNHIETSFIKININNIDCISFEEDNQKADIYIILKDNEGSMRLS